MPQGLKPRFFPYFSHVLHHKHLGFCNFPIHPYPFHHVVLLFIMLYPFYLSILSERLGLSLTELHCDVGTSTQEAIIVTAGERFIEFLDEAATTRYLKKLRIYLEYALKNLTSAKGKSSETWSGRLQLSQIAQNLRMFTLKLSPGILSRNSAKMCETVKKSWAESGPSPGVLTELRPQLLHLLVASLNLLEPEPGSVKNFLTRIHPLKQGKRKQGSKLMC